MELAQLVVFARPPAIGTTKTRLRRAFGDRGAAALYEAFVTDTLDLCARVREAGRVDVELWATSIDDPVVSEWGRRLAAIPRLQPDGDLGVRLSAAFDEGLRRYERVVIIGSDLPTLPLGLIIAAFDALNGASMALGPANDGGYYAIGATHLVRPRFEGVRWSTTTRSKTRYAPTAISRSPCFRLGMTSTSRPISTSSARISRRGRRRRPLRPAFLPSCTPLKGRV